MHTFLLDDGDLVFGSGSFETVTGTPKLTQDLGLLMREPYGINRFHPRYGSLLPAMVGEPINDTLTVRIEAEARRLLSNYIAIQRDRINRDAVKGRRSAYGTGEVIDTVRAVQVRQEYDKLHVRCVLSTMSVDEVVVLSTVRS